MDESETHFSDMEQDILLNIFKRIDCKSVGKSRCVSKGWNSTLTSKYFILQHSRHQPLVERPIVEYWFLGSFRLRTIEMDGTYTAVARDLGFQPQTEGYYHHVQFYTNSCNGLVLFRPSREDAVVVNMTTYEKVNVDYSAFRPVDVTNNCFLLDVYGIGYDNNTNDYHIIAFSDFDVECKFRCSEILAYEYSLKNRSWRRLDSYLYDSNVVQQGKPCYLNNCLYGLFFDMYCETCSLVKFQLGTDNICRFSLPQDVSVILFESRGTLYAASSDYVDGVQVWMMTDNLTHASWSKTFYIDIIGLHYPLFPLLCLSSEDNILLDMDDGRMMVYHPSSEAMVHLNAIDGDGIYRYEGCNYAETIVSPNALGNDNM